MPAQAPPGDPELQAGVRQVEEGNFEAGIATLDGVVRRLVARGGAPLELSRAHLYLGIAHLGLSQEAQARADFVKAWRLNHDLAVSPEEFAPKIVRFFEEVRKEAEAPPPERAPAPAGKKGSKAPLLIAGAAGAAGIGIALAAGGGGGSSPAATPAPTPTPSPSPSGLRCSSFEVRARDHVIVFGYLDTGIDVVQSKRLTIDATGTACYDAPRNLCTGPNGTGEAPVGGCKVGSLVAKIGDSLPICVGASYDQPAPYSGRLFLAYNDSDADNNSGSFGVMVCVAP